MQQVRTPQKSQMTVKSAAKLADAKQILSKRAMEEIKKQIKESEKKFGRELTPIPKQWLAGWNEGSERLDRQQVENMSNYWEKEKYSQTQTRLINLLSKKTFRVWLVYPYSGPEYQAFEGSFCPENFAFFKMKPLMSQPIQIDQKGKSTSAERQVGFSKTDEVYNLMQIVA